MAAGQVLLETPLYPLLADAFGLSKGQRRAALLRSCVRATDAAADRADGIGPNARWKTTTTATACCDGCSRRASPPRLPPPCAVTGSHFSLLPAVAWRSPRGWRGCGRRLPRWLRHASGMASTASKWQQIPLAFHGMQLAHLGVVAFIISVTAVKAFEKSTTLR